MFLSSTPKIWALALRSDHVKRRRFFTFSMTSGQSLRRPATSMVRSTGWLVTFFTSDTDSTTSAVLAFLTGAALCESEFRAGEAIFSTRSSRSMRASKPASELSPIGNKIRPQMSSSIRRGAVAPRICVKPSAAISAAREIDACPIFCAWTRIRSNWSSGSSRKTLFALVESSASTIIKSRKRSSKSCVKRRGSCPDSMTRSTVLNNVAPSRAAIASIASSRSAPSVNPSNWIAIS